MVGRVKRILDDLGRDVTYRSIARAYTVSTGDVVETPTDYTVRASPLYNVDFRYVDSDIVRIDDSVIIIHSSALGFTPARADRLVIGGDTWNVIDVRRHDWMDTPVAWELILRG